MNNPELIELLPCPFCGGKAKLDDFNTHPSRGPSWSVYCVEKRCCSTSDAYFPTEAGASAAWNTRDQSQAAEIERLRGLIEEQCDTLDDIKTAADSDDTMMAWSIADKALTHLKEQADER